MEYLDIVNEEDSVIGSASIQDIYDKKLLHRIVHVLIFDDKGRIALQKRSKHKSFSPEHWCTSAGGHVQKGETYEQGALREYKEELGVEAELELFKKDFFSDKRGIRKFLRIFKTTYNGPFNLNPEEVEKMEFFTIEEIQKLVDSGEKFHQELLYFLKKYFGISC